MALMWEKFVRYLRTNPLTSMIGDEELTEEYIRYAVAVEQTLRILEAGLHMKNSC